MQLLSSENIEKTPKSKGNKKNTPAKKNIVKENQTETPKTMPQVQEKGKASMSPATPNNPKKQKKERTPAAETTPADKPQKKNKKAEQDWSSKSPNEIHRAFSPGKQNVNQPRKNPNFNPQQKFNRNEQGPTLHGVNRNEQGPTQRGFNRNAQRPNRGGMRNNKFGNRPPYPQQFNRNSPHGNAPFRRFDVGDVEVKFPNISKGSYNEAIQMVLEHGDIATNPRSLILRLKTKEEATRVSSILREAVFKSEGESDWKLSVQMMMSGDSDPLKRVVYIKDPAADLSNIASQFGAKHIENINLRSNSSKLFVLSFETPGRANEASSKEIIVNGDHLKLRTYYNRAPRTDGEQQEAQKKRKLEGEDKQRKKGKGPGGNAKQVKSNDEDELDDEDEDDDDDDNAEEDEDDDDKAEEEDDEEDDDEEGDEEEEEEDDDDDDDE